MALGIIGGSGLYDMQDLHERKEHELQTPFGKPSDVIVTGSLAGQSVAFLPRHGVGHRLLPSEVPYCANIWALKKLGAQWLISASAVGSLKEHIEPGHMVIIDQFIDRTKGRASTFFGDGVVAHVAFGDPICKTLKGFILDAAKEAGATASLTATARFSRYDESGRTRNCMYLSIVICETRSSGNSALAPAAGAGACGTRIVNCAPAVPSGGTTTSNCRESGATTRIFSFGLAPSGTVTRNTLIAVDSCAWELFSNRSNGHH